MSVSFVYGQAKVAPAHPTSIPRLELCGAVLATQAMRKVIGEIDLEITEVTFYTDSKVVLGYITNETRRFHVYVANRVQMIRAVSKPHQWKYVESELNPADQATRGLRPDKLMESTWLNGPDFLKNGQEIDIPESIEQPNESDPEVRKDIVALKVELDKRNFLGAERFSRFSSLASLQRAIANLIVMLKEFKLRRDGKQSQGAQQNNEQGTGVQKLPIPTTEVLSQAMTVIVRAVQHDAFKSQIPVVTIAAGVNDSEGNERAQEHKRKATLKQSQLYRLDPFLDSEGILRVGGRLRRSEMDYGERHPALLPKDHHASRLIINHYHHKSRHQGRQITGGAIRQAGYWVIGSHRAVSKIIGACVVCRKLRGRPLEQRMADLPSDRTEVSPPFTNVGFDVFGPWTIHTRKTRGGIANSKRWGLVFTCLSSRAIHIEVLESMDASAFICALRRFFALRGPAALLRCDRGTNFIGAKTELDEAIGEMDKSKVERFVAEQGCKWIFNPPHASHFGGVWERQINTIRRVLDATFAETGKTQLTHELLITLMAEVVAIVNARPISTLPSDVDDPQPLSPSMILTMKTRPPGPPPGQFLPADIYAQRRWRRAQYLAEQFWVRWKREYLQNLQPRPKWNTTRRDLREGDVVLLRDAAEYRNDWPLGRVTEAIKSEDGRVRKANVLVVRDDKRKQFLRPIKELVLLVPNPSQEEQ